MPEDLELQHQPYCEKHKITYFGACGPCAREHWERSKGPVFNYQVDVYQDDGVFTQKVIEKGKRGFEVIAFAITPHFEYVVLYRVHRPH